MKISMVSEHANPLAPPGSVDSGGQNVHVGALSRALAERGHQVTIYTRRDDRRTPTRVPFAPGVDVVHLLAGPTARIPKDQLLPHMGAFGAELAAAWALDPPDIVHSHFWMSGLASLMATRQLAAATEAPPLVHTFHALGSVKRRHQGTSDTSPAGRAHLEPLVGTNVHTVIATCADEVSELRALGIPSHRIEVAPCGVDPVAFSPDGPSEPRGAAIRLVSAGRLVPRKGVDLIIEALGLLADEGMVDVELEVVGGGVEATGDPELARLSALANTRGVADRVHFRGQVARAQMPALLRSADAVVCTPWYEPFGIVPLESMACGTPVIAAAVGGMRDSVLDRVSGLHVPPRDPVAIAAAVRRLADETSFRCALGVAGRHRVEAEFTWERVAELTEEIYVRVRDRSGRARAWATGDSLLEVTR